MLNYKINIQVDFSFLNTIAKDCPKLVQQLLNQEIDVNVSNKHKNILLKLSFEYIYFDSKISNYILQLLIAIGTNINKIYNKRFFLCFQILEIEDCKFFDDYYNKE